MQRSLGFSRITEAERAASEATAAVEVRRTEEERAALLRPGPGRPKLERSANDVLAAAAAAAAIADEEEPVPKRGKYCNWFTTPLIHDILAAYQLNLHSPWSTVPAGAISEVPFREAFRNQRHRTRHVAAFLPKWVCRFD